MQDALTFKSRPLFLKEGIRRLAFLPPEIIYIEAADDFVRVVTVREGRLLSYTMTGIMSELHPEVFVRVSRFYIVNLDHIRSVEGTLISIADMEVAIHKSFSRNFFQLLLRRWDET